MKKMFVIVGVVLALISTSGLTGCQPVTMTIGLSPNVINPNGVTTAAGTLSSKASGAKVSVQRKLDGKWATVASTNTTSGGRYSVRFRSIIPGKTLYRSVAGKTISKTVTLRVRKTVYLNDERERIVGGGCYARNAAVSINGRSYTNSIRASSVCSGGSLEVDLKRSTERLQLTAGVTDDAQSSMTVDYRIYGDGVLLRSGTAGLGQAFPIDLDVRDRLRLSIEWRARSGYARFALGNVRIVY